MPHLELSHHSIYKNQSYDKFIGHEALRLKGAKKWNQRVHKVIATLYALVHYDVLHSGGGNALKIIDPPADVEIGSNQAGLTGGIKLWELDSARF